MKLRGQRVLSDDAPGFHSRPHAVPDVQIYLSPPSRSSRHPTSCVWSRSCRKRSHH